MFFFCLIRKIRLDIDDRFHSINETKSSSIFNPTALISKLNCELHLLPNDRFSVQYLPVSHTTAPTEFNDEYLSKNGLVLRCKLIEIDIPLVPILRLRIFPRYPEEQPEILSLTKTMPPKLESTGMNNVFVFNHWNNLSSIQMVILSSNEFQRFLFLICLNYLPDIL